MKEETPKCKYCNQPMFEVGGIGKSMELGGMETMIVNNLDAFIDMTNKFPESTLKLLEHRQWVQRGQREIKLYQCPGCKEVKIY